MSSEVQVIAGVSTCNGVAARCAARGDSMEPCAHATGSSKAGRRPTRRMCCAWQFASRRTGCGAPPRWMPVSPGCRGQSGITSPCAQATQHPVQRRHRSLHTVISCTCGYVDRIRRRLWLTSSVNAAHAPLPAICRRSVPQFGAYWAAATLALGFAYRLSRWQAEMRATQAAGTDPFKATSIAPAAIGSLAYIAFVQAGRVAMRHRPAFDCKPYMLVYNAFQVRHTTPYRIRPRGRKTRVRSRHARPRRVAACCPHHRPPQPGD